MWLYFLLAIPILLLWPPRFLLGILGRLSGAIYFLPGERKVVYLTIDDGPSPWTWELLAALHRHRVTATFFVIGQEIKRHPGALRDILAAGHGLGNHDLRNRITALVPTETLRTDLLETQRLLGQEPGWFRPGVGFYGPGLLALTRELGYRVVLGDVYPHDPQLPGFWARFLLRWKTAPGSIIILHDGTEGRVRNLIQTLDALLPELRRHGYTLEKLPPA